MSGFTPGPWRIEEEPYLHVRSDQGCVFASDYTTEANASLIAAAPDLYEALNNIIAVIGAMQAIGTKPKLDGSRALDAARSALAKADGLSPSPDPDMPPTATQGA